MKLSAAGMLLWLVPALVYADQPEDCGNLDRPYVCSRAENGPSLNWPGKTATFRVNDSSVPDGLSVQTVITVIRNSFASWQAVTGSDFTFNYGGRTTQSKVGFDYRTINENENIVIFQSKWSHDEGIIGLTTATFNAQSGEIFDADIELNAENYDFSTNDAEVKTDVQNTVTHEAGHFIGFDHTDKDGSTIDPTCAGTATMSRRAQPGETSKRKVWYTDQVAMRTVYPKNRPVQYCSAAETPQPTTTSPPHITQLSYGLGGCNASGTSWLAGALVALLLARRRMLAFVASQLLIVGVASAAQQPDACLSQTDPKPFACSHIGTEATASLHWKEGAASYKINTSSIPVGLDKQKVIDAINLSFSQWSHLSGVQLTLTYDGETTSTIVGRNYLAPDKNENLVLFQSDWPHEDRAEDKLVIALTTATYNGLDGLIYDADIELNAEYFHFTTDDVGVQTDLRNTITHEAGHFIGFDHPDKNGSKIPIACSSTACMSAHASAGETSKRQLSPTDIMGAQTVYPAGKAPQYCSTAESPAPAAFPAPVVQQTSSSLNGSCNSVSLVSLWPLALVLLRRPLRSKQKRSQ